MKALILLILFPLMQISCNKDFSDYVHYHPPVDAHDGLAVATLDDVGMDSNMFAKALGRIYANKYDQVHSILVYKNGYLVYEEYMEGNKHNAEGQYFYGERIKWHRDSVHIIMSCTKSVTSAIIGIAVDQGYIDVNESIFTYLPDYQQYNSQGKESITVEHLLTMTSGLAWDEWSSAHGTTANDIDRIYIECQNDPLACILSKELVYTPGTHFNYSGGNMIVLGEILRNATGKNILDFGKQHLFDPLGIDSVYWYHFDNGTYACGGAMFLTPRSMMKIGVTFLNEGMWNGQQIVSKEWVEKSSTTYRSNSRINVPLDDAGKCGYAYTWWTNEVDGPSGKVDLFQASGWGGQEIMVIPELDMVVVFTGGNYVVKKHVYELLERFILPSIYS